jgi:hypothetical protein
MNSTVDTGRNAETPVPNPTGAVPKLPNPAGSDTMGQSQPLPNLTPDSPAREPRHQGTVFDPPGGGPDRGRPGKG